MSACLRARDAWENAGRPGEVEQLALFPGRYLRAEVERARRKDQPRRRRKRA